MEIAIRGGAFVPQCVTVPPGTAVKWVNYDDVSHQVQSDVTEPEELLFRSEYLQPGDEFSHTFQAAGTNPYHCAVHPHMVGSVTVA